MTIKDPIREAFEKWASNNWACPNTIQREGTDPYVLSATRTWWMAWEAALRRIPHAAEILSGELAGAPRLSIGISRNDDLHLPVRMTFPIGMHCGPQTPHLGRLYNEAVPRLEGE